MSAAHAIEISANAISDRIDPKRMTVNFSGGRSSASAYRFALEAISLHEREVVLGCDSGLVQWRTGALACRSRRHGQAGRLSSTGLLHSSDVSSDV